LFPKELIVKDINITPLIYKTWNLLVPMPKTKLSCEDCNPFPQEITLILDIILLQICEVIMNKNLPDIQVVGFIGANEGANKI